MTIRGDDIVDALREGNLRNSLRLDSYIRLPKENGEELVELSFDGKFWVSVPVKIIETVEPIGQAQIDNIIYQKVKVSFSTSDPEAVIMQNLWIHFMDVQYRIGIEENDDPEIQTWMARSRESSRTGERFALMTDPLPRDPRNDPAEPPTFA